VLEAAGLNVRLVSSSQARQLAGRPKTDRLDAQWIARLAEMGLLRPSFVPPPEIRELRDWTRARLHLVHDRTREWQRLEKLLEGALVKLSSVVSALAGNKTARAIIEALIAGERDPRRLAGLARTRLRGRIPELEQSLDGAVFGPHHARLARLHLDRIDAMDRQVDALDDEIAACLDAIPAACGITADGARDPAPGQDAAVLDAVSRLSEIPGISPVLARAIIAETGLDMTQFPTAGHLAAWAGLAPAARQSGPRTRKPKKGQGDSYLRNYCTQAAGGTARTGTFLGERLRRLSRRIGGGRARCAVARSILVIVWHLLADPQARYHDLGPDWHTRKTDTDRRTHSLLKQLQALHPGSSITITAA
jgi:transposase